MTHESTFLLIQFRTDQSGPHEVDCFRRYGKMTDKTLIVKNIFNDHFDQPDQELAGITGVIFGGSGEFGLVHDREKLRPALEKITPLINYVHQHNIPVLGACFGHQLIGDYFGAELVADPDLAESGSFPVRLTEEGMADALFADIPQTFIAQLGHKESLTNVPKGAVLLARGERSPIHAYRLGQAMYGVQFHAELGLTDLLFRLNLYPDYLHGKSIEDLRDQFEESPLAPQVFRNFLKLAKNIPRT